MERLFEARKLVESGAYEHALDSYLSALNGTVGNIRELKLESSLSDLLEHHPSAMEPLSVRLAELSEKIVCGHCTRRLSEEWLALSRALGIEEPELELLERLKSAGSSKPFHNDYVALMVVRNSLDQCLGEKRFKLLELYFDRLGHHFMRSWVEVESNLLFPNSLEASSKMFVEEELESLIDDAALLFEASLALDRGNVADELVRKVFAAASSPKSFRRFIVAAERAGYDDRVNSLNELARQYLSPKEFATLQASLCS